MNVDNILKALSQIVGKLHLLTGSAMDGFLTDHRRRYHGKALAVVRPGSVDELCQVVRFCHEHRIPMVPQGGNTGLCGGATPSLKGDALVIALARLNRIRAVDKANLTITVEAGCTLAAIRQAAESVDRLFALDLPSQGTAQIGGILATNAGGVAVLRYGNARDMVLGIEAVLPDGRRYEAMRALRKDNTGYDLKQLLIGSEGTLAIITAAVLKLHTLPTHRSTAWLAVKHPADAGALLNLMRSVCGDRLTAFEIISRPSVEMVFKHIANTEDPMSVVYDWYVLAEATDVAEGDLLETLFLEALQRGVEQNLIQDAMVAATAAQAKQLWHIRESMNDAQRIEGISIKHDVSIPVAAVADFLAASEALLTRDYPGVRIVAFGHIGDGNIHYNLSMSDADLNVSFIKKRPEINQKIYDLVDSLGGSFSAEHGIGQLKREELRRYRGDVAVDLMRQIKQVFDPLNLMNPDKLFLPVDH